MKKKLFSKRLIKEMSFQDKVKLLLADHSRRCETKGKDRLITSDEEQTIIGDLQDRRQINALNEIVAKYNLSTLAVSDVRLRTLNLELVMSRIDTFVVAMHGWGNSRDRLSDLLYFAEGEKGKAAQKIAEEIMQVRNDVPTQFRFFTPSDPEDDNFEAEIEHYKTREPNVLFQKVFLRAIEAYKALKKAIYIIEYLENDVGFRLLDDDDTPFIEMAEEKLRCFEELDGFLKVVEVYRKSRELNMMKQKGFSEPEFERALDHFPEFLELSDDEKKEMEEMTDGVLRRKQGVW